VTIPVNFLTRHQLILNFHAYKSDVADRDIPVEMLPAVYCHQKTGDECKKETPPTKVQDKVK
jgi:hypothetical protein